MEHLIDCPSLFVVPRQAHFNELFEVGGPLVRDLWSVFEDYFLKEFAIFKLVEGRLACSQLVCKDAKRPDVDRLCIPDACHDLGGDPRWSAFLSLAIGLLLREKASEAQVRNLYIAIR